jgi:hypothetical protein
MLGYTLTLGTAADWLEFSAVLHVRLTPQELVALGFAVLTSMDEDDAHDTAQAACFGYVGGRRDEQRPENEFNDHHRPQQP